MGFARNRGISLMAGAALAMLGTVGLATVAGPGTGPTVLERAPAKAPDQQQQRQAPQTAVLVAEEERASRRRWATYRYRKSGESRSAGDRAHKRMKNQRRGGK